MKSASQAMKIWQLLSPLPGGKWLFSRIVGWKAPYFASINAHFEDLRPGYSEVHIDKRRKVLNHIGTVHAIAMCNMAELAAGTMTDVSIPATHRWIPKSMTVDYLAKARTNLRAIARLEPIPECGDVIDLPVTVNILDEHDQQVVRAVITMKVSQR